VVRSWLKLQERGKIIKQVQKKLEEAKNKQENLKRQLAQVESRDFIEEEARNKLNMGKEGEIVLILPSLVFKQPTPSPPAKSPNWKKWLELFY